MNPKRLAGYINLVAAIAFMFVGVRSVPINKFLIGIGVIFLLIGFIRLRKTPPGPPSPPAT